MTSTTDRDSMRRILARLSDGAVTLDRLTPEEQTLILKALTATAVAQKSPDEIAAETMALLHEVVSSRLLIVAEKHPELARQLVERVRTSIAHTGTAALAIADAAKPAALPSQERRTADDLISGRSALVLKRDYAVFWAMREAGNKLVPLKTIYAKVGAIEADLSENALTSHLGRLEDQGLLQRPRRGRYNTTELGTAYFAKLPAALHAEGEDLPRM